ncbi:hypothetical protein QC762_0063180 [Podospora pseudocomata]|uniref:Uncharacterized protein n=1 Tax=Podospora pseudocomata TaxID=2093779 RepID=A0ABR0GEL0_9PEZI|nr:hypothetical protein QC762_0063180 [Podospora pseudocomata]
MSRAHLLRASDPRGKVFGVHGLAAKGEGSRFTQPNYSKNTNEVYLDAALRVIEEGGLFELLSHAGTGCIDVDAVQCLRSWVPDWSLARHAEPLGCISGQPPYRAGEAPNVLDLPSFANVLWFFEERNWASSLSLRHLTPLGSMLSSPGLLIGDRTKTEWPAPDSVRGLYDRWLLTMRLYEKSIDWWKPIEGTSQLRTTILKA